jgi:hypothetical protein
LQALEKILLEKSCPTIKKIAKNRFFSKKRFWLKNGQK